MHFAFSKQIQNTLFDTLHNCHTRSHMCSWHALIGPIRNVRFPIMAYVVDHCDSAHIDHVDVSSSFH